MEIKSSHASTAIMFIYFATAIQAHAWDRKDGNAAIAAERRGDLGQAIGLYTRVLKVGGLTPRYAAITHNNRGICYSRTGQYDSSIADFDAAIRLVQNFPDPYDNLAVAYDWKGEETKGLKYADKAVDLAPKNAAFLVTRAQIYERLGDRRKAAADYHSALKLNPDMKWKKKIVAGLNRLGLI